MRRAALFGILAALLATGVPASAGSECGFEDTRVDPAPETHVYAELETRDCPEGRSLTLAVSDGTGRNSVEWFDDERGLGLEAFRPPYFVSWTDSDRGCVIIAFVFALGAVELPCVAGSPPPPPTLP